jgi:hypothetical protein
MADYSLQQIFGVTPAVCSRYRAFGIRLLLKCLRILPEGQIAWPNRIQVHQFANLIRQRHPLLKSAFGFVDGLHLPVARASDLEVENAFYNGWCSSHFTSNIFVFAPNGTIIYANLNTPGSWHDSAVSRHLYTKLLDNTPKGYYLIADTAFTTSQTDLRDRLRTPPKANFINYSANPKIAQQEIRFNEQLVSARQAAEWGMQSLQGSFGRLKLPMPAEDAEGRGIVYELCSRLHNVRARLVSISQIRTVYEGVWAESGSGLYNDFKHFLFKDIRKTDRIQRFYNFLV